MRQLNIYDFHKSNPKSSPQNEFENIHFKRNNPQELSLIKRKTKPEKHRKPIKELSILTLSSTQESSQELVDTVEIEEIKSEVIDVATHLINLKKKVSKLQKKYDLLFYCKNDLDQRNEKIKDELFCIQEKEHNLKQLFFCIINQFFPSFIPKETLMLPDQSEKANFINKDNIIIDMIVDKIKSFYFKQNKVQTSSQTTDQNFIEKEGKFSTIEELYSYYLDPCKKIASSIFEKDEYCALNPNNELMHCSKIRQLLKKYLNMIENNITITDNEQTELDSCLEKEKSDIGAEALFQKETFQENFWIEDKPDEEKDEIVKIESKTIFEIRNIENEID